MSAVGIGLDLALAATSGGAVLYCAVLSRRLSRLHRLKGGVGLAITELSSAVAASREGSEGMKSAAVSAVAELNEAFARVDTKRQDVLDLIETMDGQAGGMERRASEAREAAERSLSAVTRRARIELEALSETVGIAHETANALGARPEGASPAEDVAKTPEVDAEEERKAPPRRLPGARAAVQRAASRPNPFLRVAS